MLFFSDWTRTRDGFGPVNNQELTILIFSIPSNLAEHSEGVMLHDLAYQRFNLWFLKHWAVRWAMTSFGVIMNSYCWHAPELQDGNGWAVMLWISSSPCGSLFPGLRSYSIQVGWLYEFRLALWGLWSCDLPRYNMLWFNKKNIQTNYKTAIMI